MRPMLARVAAAAVLALSASFVVAPASAAELQPGVIDLNATDWIEDDFSIDPRGDIFVSQSGYVVVVLLNFGSAVGYEVLLDDEVIATPYVEQGDTKTIILDDLPLGSQIVVTAADGYELARLTLPSDE